MGGEFSSVRRAIMRPRDATCLTISANEAIMFPKRHVKLFRIGCDQAVRIPLEFELPGEDAIIRKEGDRLIIELAPAKSLLGLLATQGPLEEDFPPISDPRPDSFEF